MKSAVKQGMPRVKENASGMLDVSRLLRSLQGHSRNIKTYSTHIAGGSNSLQALAGNIIQNLGYISIDDPGWEEDAFVWNIFLHRDGASRPPNGS
jgi:hypothetical protein